MSDDKPGPSDNAKFDVHATDPARLSGPEAFDKEVEKRMTRMAAGDLAKGVYRDCHWRVYQSDEYIMWEAVNRDGIATSKDDGIAKAKKAIDEYLD